MTEIAILAETAEQDMNFVKQVVEESFKFAYLAGQKLSKCRELFKTDPGMAADVYGFDNFGQTCASPQGFNMQSSTASKWADVADTIDWHLEHNKLKLEQFLRVKSWNKVYEMKAVISGKDKEFSEQWISKAQALGPYDLREEIVEYKKEQGTYVPRNEKILKTEVTPTRTQNRWEEMKRKLANYGTKNPTISMRLLFQLINQVEEEYK